MGVHVIEDENILLAEIASDKPSICGFFVSTDPTWETMTHKYVELSQEYPGIRCYSLDIDETANIMMKADTGALPKFRLYKGGMENGEAGTLEELHGLFNKAQKLS